MLTISKIGLFFLALSLNVPSLASSDKTACDTENWRCHGSFYVTAGAVFAHVLFLENHLSFAPLNQTNIAFSPDTHFPNNFGGMRLGFATGLGKKTPFYFEFDYNETFNKSKADDQIRITISSKAFVGTLGYVFNPESRLRLNALSGAAILSNYVTTDTVAPRPYISLRTNNVDIDPFLGGSLTYQLNAKLALRVSELYDIGNYNRILASRLVTLFMLHYYPE